MPAVYTEEDRGHSSPCWIWQGSKRPNGYGCVWVPGVGYRGAHRVSYQTFVGDIPGGHNVCHHCDVKACINPEHLFTGTQADNIADKVRKGRQARGKTHFTHTQPERIARGSRNGFAQLTEAQAAEIFKRIDQSGETFTEIACDYNISRYTVGLMARGKRWQHVRKEMLF